jgi:hypothetical protein
LQVQGLCLAHGARRRARGRQALTRGEALLLGHLQQERGLGSGRLAATRAARLDERGRRGGVEAEAPHSGDERHSRQQRAHVATLVRRPAQCQTHTDRAPLSHRRQTL